MTDLNNVILLGRLTWDPELRYTPKGSAVCDLGLAVNRTYKKDSGEEVEDTCYLIVTAWGKQAERCAEYLKKGMSVYVEGRLKYDKWEAKDGTKKSRISVVAERIPFLSFLKDESKEELKEEAVA